MVVDFRRRRRGFDMGTVSASGGGGGEGVDADAETSHGIDEVLMDGTGPHTAMSAGGR